MLPVLLPVLCPVDPSTYIHMHVFHLHYLNTVTYLCNQALVKTNASKLLLRPLTAVPRQLSKDIHAVNFDISITIDNKLHKTHAFVTVNSPANMLLVFLCRVCGAHRQQE